MSDSAVIAADPDENSVPTHCETARYLMRWLIAVCGDPCALVARAWLSPKERRSVIFWLRPVEAIVRRLLVAEAARLAKTPPPTKSTRRRARPRFCRVAFPDPENSTGWAVRFSVLPAPVRPATDCSRGLPRLQTLSDDAAVLAPARLARAAMLYRPHRSEPCPHTEPPRPKARRAAGSPWPLAKRIEAVLRVLANPQAYARRLARRLRQDTARFYRACHPPPPPEPGERPPYGYEPLRHASEHALRALSEISDQRGCCCATAPPTLSTDLVNGQPP